MQFNVAFNNSSPDLGGLTASEQQQVLDVMNAAATIWSHYLTTANITLNIAITIDNSLFSGNVLAEGGPEAFAPTGATFNGKTVYESDAGLKLRTGQDINGAAPDIGIDLTVNSIRNMLAFKTDDTASPAGGRSDALSVFLHEIGHGLGILDASEDPSFHGVSVYDTFVQNGNFTGANAEQAANAPSGIPLEPGSLSHIRESSAYGGDLMSTAITPGTNVHISAIDLGILQDIGVAVRLPTSGDDVLYGLVGVDLHLGAGNDIAYAVTGGGNIYAEDGNDTVYVSSWNPSPAIDGGNGNDTLNITGGVQGNGFGNGFSTGTSNLPVFPNFAVRNFETINLGAGYNYTIAGDSSLVAGGAALTIDGSALSAANNFSFTTDGASDGSTFSGNITLIGGAGNDFFEGGSGASIFNGGAGNDTVSFNTGNFFYNGTAGVTANLSIAGPQSIGGPRGGTATFIGIENLIGTSRNDTLTGDAGNNILDGNIRNGSGGDDVLNGGGGDDTLIAAGNSIVDGGTGTDTADFRYSNLASSSFTISHSGRTTTVSGPLGINVSLTNVEFVQFVDTTLQIGGPVVTTSNVAAQRNQTIAASSLFSATDLSGDTITRYQLWDGNSDPLSGHFVVNGVAQAARTVIDITAAQLNQVGFVTGRVSDTLQIRAFDGNAWSATDAAQWSPFAVSVPANNAPVVTTANLTAHAGQTLAASSLFTVSDTDGDAITEYQLWDTTADPASGYWMVNGVAQPARTVIDISAAQLSQVTYVAGSVDNALQIRAFDGISWSAADNAQWSPFMITAPGNHAPVVTTANLTPHAGQTLAASNLFTVSDADNDTITRYQLWDATTDPASGYFTINGVAQAPRTVIDISAAQLGQVSFVAGSVPDSLQIRAFDGTAWSAADNAQWSPFTVSPVAMTTVVGSGLGNTAVTGMFIQSFNLTSAGSSSFTVSNGFGTIVATGSNFSYSGTNVTGGMITGIRFTNNGIIGNFSDQTWTGFSVAAVDAFNARATGNINALNNLFFGGDDTFTYAIDPIIKFDTPVTSLSGFGGNDTFNLNGWSVNTFVDGGGGNDTLNITGGISSAVGDLYAFGIEAMNLGAGYDYNISALDGLVTSGKTLTVDGSALGASNHLNFTLESATNTTKITGNLVIFGGAGNDFFEGGKGSNSFNGGAGTDTVSFVPSYNEIGRQSYNGPGVTANLSLAGFQTLGGLTGGSASFNSIENLIGTPWSDTLTGDAGDNVLDGGMGGADVLNGGAGNDTLIAYGANSVLNGGAGDDTMMMSQGTADGGSGTDTVVLDTNFLGGPYGTITSSNGVFTITTVNGFNVTLTNVEFVRFNNETLQIAGPAMTTANVAAQRNQSFALSSLFSATDLSGNAITQYQLRDDGSDPLSGHFVIGGVAQAAGSVINITAAQLAQVSFVAGRVNDTLEIRAYDGSAWSAADNAQWSPFTVSVPADNAPLVTTSNRTLHGSQTLAASSLFMVSDADGDAITRYQLWDATTDPQSGHFTVNGVVQASRTVIDISAAQLAQTSFVTGGVADSLQIRAFDGIAWSAADNAQWAPFTVTPTNNPPVVTTSNKTAQAGQSLAASSLFSVSDPDGDAITEYQLWDSTADPASGYFTVGGVTQAARTVIDILASQLGQVSFVAGSVGDTLQIRAFDGTVWSAGDNAQWAPFTVTVPVNHPPVVTTASGPVQRNQTLAASSLFTVSDPDGDTITRYQLWDATTDPSSGHFTVNGAVQASRTVIDISAAQLAQTSFVTGSVADSLQIRAYDGTAWSAADNAKWAPFTLTPTNNPPVVTTSNKTLQAGQNVLASTLFSVSDADGDAITEYQLWDSITDPASGYFTVGGTPQAARTVIDISASQLAQVSFVAGSVGDTLQVRAFDGTAWSAGDNAQWAPFTITVPVNHPPVVTTADKNATAGQSLAASSLFSVSDPDGDAITEYQFWDGTTDPSSGHFTLGGVTQAARTVIDIPASQLGQVAFLAGAAGFGDTLQVRAFDGKSWSAADNAQWAPFHIVT